jgi:hypothetical protein
LLSLATLLAFVVWFGLAGVGVGDEPAASGDDSREVIIRIAKGYELFQGAERIPLKMQQEPVLRWPNPTREVPEGATFVWTLDGRPEAIGCVWKHGVLSHAFHSLSSSKLVAEHDGRTIWHPEKAGIEFRNFAKAPRPADSAVKRLSQMKELARRFTCRLASDERTGEQLRLLPQPLYRYKIERKDLVDGALFAFVQGTDPEVILVLEAARQDAESEWQYVLTRRSMLALEGELDGERIWSVAHGAGTPGEAWFQGGIATPN